MSEAEDAIASTDPVPEVEEGQPETDTTKNEEETSADVADADVAAEKPAKEDAETDNSNEADTDANGDEKIEVTETDEAKETPEAKDEEEVDAAKVEEQDDSAAAGESEADAEIPESANDEAAKGEELSEETPGDDDVDVEMKEEAAAAGDEKESEEKETKTPKKKRSKRGAVVATPGTSSASKRQRKSTTSFSPQNFKEDKDTKKIEIPSGRGVKLDSIEIIKATVSKKKTTDPILAELHKFILGGPGGCLGKGRTGKKLLKRHILEFSGYLPDVVEGDEEAEEMEREAEERMQTKAENLSLPLIKTFCDVLSINRGPEKGKVATKGVLIDRLLDFLADPSADGVIVNTPAAPTYAGKKRGPKPKKRQTEEEEDEEMEDEAEEAEEEGEDSDGLSEKALKTFVKAYLICFNSDKASEEHALQIASDKFGEALGDKKEVLEELLKDALPKEKKEDKEE